MIAYLFCHMNIVDNLILSGYLKTNSIISAFRCVKRSDFTVSGDQSEAEENRPLSIGCKQTISQPLTVAFMFDLLQPEEGDIILDIGSGSGWTSALLAYLAGEKGKVYAIERMEKLKNFGSKNLKRYEDLAKRVEFICSDGVKGLADKAPFDKILVSAAAKEAPKDLIKQLKLGGNMVIPIGSESFQSIVFIHKDLNNKLTIREFPGFTFVPLV